MNEKPKDEQVAAKRPRSPNYPTLLLSKAIEISRGLYEKFGRNATPMVIIMQHLRYAPKSSSGLQTIASLAYYGLLISEGYGGSRRLRISDLAFTILKNPDQAQKENAIKIAAQKPNIFKAIIGKYPDGIPDSAVLTYDLEKEYKVNPKSLEELVKIFYSTIKFANISGSSIIEEEKYETNGQNLDEFGDNKMINSNSNATEVKKKTPSPSINEGEREIANYPIGRGLMARILVSGGSPVTVDSIEKLRKLLEINKDDLPEPITDEKTTEH